MPSFEILKSEKNRDVLLVEGFLFWFDRATPKGRKYWKCIYCYRGYDGDVKNKCLSRVITSPNDPVAIICKNHNHCRDTVLVEHMKAFGSIRRLASSLRNPSRKASISPATSTNSSPEENIPSTSEPLDLSIPSKRPSSTQASPPFPPKAAKKAKRDLADVLETLYNRLQKPPSKTKTPKTTPTINENSSSFEKIVEESSSPPSSKKIVEEVEEKNLSFQKIDHLIPSVFPTHPPPPPSTTTNVILAPQQQTPQVIDLSAVTGQPGLANPNLPYRFSSSWLALAAMSNIFAAANHHHSNNNIINNITSQASLIPK